MYMLPICIFIVQILYYLYSKEAILFYNSGCYITKAKNAYFSILKFSLLDRQTDKEQI